MFNYDLIYIVHPSVSDEELPSAITKVGEVITRLGGSTAEVNQWGRKKLAFPIKKAVEGNYVFAKIELSPTRIKELDSTLKLSDNVLRYLLVRSNN